jgi:hypothetical protein
MIKRFADYLSSIGMTEKAYVARVEECLTLLTEIAPERLQEIVIEDIVQEDGTRQYLHLNAFTSNHLLGMDNFLSGDTVQMYRLTRRVVSLQTSATNFDFKTGTTRSRIHIVFRLESHAPGTGWVLQGSGTNAAHIWRITKERVRPQLAE